MTSAEARIRNAPRPSSVLSVRSASSDSPSWRQRNGGARRFCLDRSGRRPGARLDRCFVRSPLDRRPERGFGNGDRAAQSGHAGRGEQAGVLPLLDLRVERGHAVQPLVEDQLIENRLAGRTFRAPRAGRAFAGWTAFSGSAAPGNGGEGHWALDLFHSCTVRRRICHMPTDNCQKLSAARFDYTGCIFTSMVWP